MWNGNRWREWFAVAFILLIPVSVGVGPSILNLQWSDLAAFGFLMSSILVGGSWRSVGRPLRWAAVAYVGSAVPSFVHTAHPSASLVELAKTVYVVSLGMMLVDWMTNASSRERGMRVFTLTAGTMVVVAVGVWGVATLTGRVFGGWVSVMDVPNVGRVVRVNATLPSPALLANYLTIGVPVLAASLAMRSHRPGVVGWGVLAIGALAALTTASHSIAGFFTSAAIAAPCERRWDRRGRRLLGLLAAGTIVFALISTTVAIPRVQIKHEVSLHQEAVFPSHAFVDPSAIDQLTMHIPYAWVSYGLLKRLAWEMWRVHPWVGHGLDEFSFAVSRAFQEKRIHYSRADPHSTWCGALAETGLIGVLGLAGFWIVLLRPGRDVTRRGAEGRDQWQTRALYAGLVGVLVNSLHVDIMHFRFLWVGAALFSTATHVALRVKSHDPTAVATLSLADVRA